MNVLEQTTHVLPCGAILDLDRDRSHGILQKHELTFCRDAGIPVAFDPLQSGWVPLTTLDDLRGARQRAVPMPQPVRAQPLSDLNLGLRAWALSDAPRFQELLDDARIWDQMPEDHPNPFTQDMAEALIHIANNSNHHQVLAILLDGTPVGQVRIEFDHGGPTPNEAEISYWIGPDHWGQGFASAVVAAFARQCLTENPALTSLFARVKNGNAASLRVLDKAGFIPQGADCKPGWTRLRKRRLV